MKNPRAIQITARITRKKKRRCLKQGPRVVWIADKVARRKEKRCLGAEKGLSLTN